MAQLRQPGPGGPGINGLMRFSPHFYANRERADRVAITEEMCIEVVNDPVHTEVQENGRVRHWAAVDLFGDGQLRYLRVVTSSSGDYVFTAFADEGFRRKMRRS